MVKLRLRRQGRKGKPFYYIVAADARAPRDGRFIERIGSYNPNTNPATIDLNLDDAVRWLGNGAVPTDTCRAILSYKGAMYKHHLNKGVTKGALTQEQADEKFSTWLSEKESKVSAKIDSISKSAADSAAAAHKREEAVKLDREKAIAERLAPEVEATEEVPEATEEVVEATAEAAPEATEETVEAPEVATEATEEVTEAPAEAPEAANEEAVEVKAEETKEEPAAEESAPAEEATEEKPSEDKA
ncbi:MAG: 30S ribosomal protein S16 [Bacteroidia bacterium]|nr:30S ribosomal protein S16 [Bacteroidia bacterium]